MQIPPWSHSAIKLFDTCPRKYQAERVTKEVKFTDSQATLYGKALHKAAEEFVRDGSPVPEQFAFIQPYLDKLVQAPGEKFCELKMGVTEDLTPCDFFANNVWCRYVADFVRMNGSKGYLLDYKTSKSTRYADTTQLDLGAAMLFATFPELETVNAMLLFVVAQEPVDPITYRREQMAELFSRFDSLLTQREAAYKSGVFNSKPNGLCKGWCGVKSCGHWRE